MEQTDRTLYEFIAEVRTTLARIEERLLTLLSDGRKTDSRVEALETAYNSMEDEVRSLREEVKDMIESNGNALKVWVLKALIGTTLLGSLVWLPEARETLLQIIRALI